MSTSRIRDSLRTDLQQRDFNKRSLLFVPIALLVFGGFVFPFLILIRISLAGQPSGAPYEEGSLTLGSFVHVVTSDLIQYIIGFSILYAVTTTLLALVVATFYAYAAWRTSGVTKYVLLFSSILPLLTTLAVKTYAWAPLLAPNGNVNDLLLLFSVIGEPVQFAPGLVGAVVGQVYNMVPFGILAIYSVLISIEESKIEAARDLGASRIRSFYEVVLPEIIPGIAVASIIFVTWSVGAYAAPQLLGGGAERSYAVQIESYMLAELQWAFAGALSVLMLLTGAIGVLIALWVLNQSEGGVRIAGQ